MREVVAMRPIKTVSLVFGVLGALLGLLLAAAGAPLVWAHATQRDAGGYYSTGARAFAGPGYAVVSDNIDLRSTAEDGDWAGVLGAVGDARLTARSADSQPVFLGVAPTADVMRYLGDSEYRMVDRMRQMGDGVWSPHYRFHAGDTPPGLPGAQSFWAASTSGAGTRTLTWDLQSGDWTVVLMNADASPGIDVSATAGFRSGLLLPIGIGLLAAAGIALLASVALLVYSATGRDTSGPGAASLGTAGATPAGPPSVYPVRVRAALDPDVSRWLWLVKWVLVIPHVFVLAFLWVAFVVLTLAAGVAILFTGRYPRPIFEFTTGILRWQWRVSFYALTLGTDRYPPFSLRPDPSYPADLEVAYPEHLSRGLVLVKWWLLALPHYLVIGVFGALAWTTTWSLAWIDQDGGRYVAGGLGLTGLLALIAGVTLLVTGRYPRSVFDFVLGMQRWTLRVAAYASLMRDEYPPFRLDLGGEEPEPAPPTAPPVAPDPAAARA